MIFRIATFLFELRLCLLCTLTASMSLKSTEGPLHSWRIFLRKMDDELITKYPWLFTRTGDICSSGSTLYVAFSQLIFFTECRWYSKSAVQERIIAVSCFILMLSRIKNVSSLQFSFRLFAF